MAKTKYGSRYKSKKNINKSKNNTTILCNLSYSNNIPEKDAIILSCSLFKLNDMYRDITIYINGLKKILKWIENNNHKIHLYIYYDHSIENDKLFLDLKPVLDNNSYSNVKGPNAAIVAQISEFQKSSRAVFIKSLIVS